MQCTTPYLDSWILPWTQKTPPTVSWLHCGFQNQKLGATASIGTMDLSNSAVNPA